MAQKINLTEIVQTAKERGYFSLGDYPGLKLSASEFKELFALLQKKKVPFESIKGRFTQEEATEIVNCLRRGVPPSSDVSKFNVGRDNLIQKLTRDLQKVSAGGSEVRFMNADYGHGKTHSLYLLREIAFKKGFVVSIITLSQASCPIHDFMSVYNKIMWNLRTQSERQKPALENVLDRWLDTIKRTGEEKAKQIIKLLPDDLKSALHAYHESVSPIRPNEEKRLFVLKYLAGEQINLKDLRRISINNRISGANALQLLGNMALFFKNLGYNGICILFDEADPIHSFSRFQHQDQAYNNLFKIINQSSEAPSCYFLYATTPSFFGNYSQYWGSDKVLHTEDIFELDKLNNNELKILSGNLCSIYSIYKKVEVPGRIRTLLKELTDQQVFSDSLGIFVRKCIAILDEKI